MPMRCLITNCLHNTKTSLPKSSWRSHQICTCCAKHIAYMNPDYFAMKGYRRSAGRCKDGKIYKYGEPLSGIILSTLDQDKTIHEIKVDIEESKNKTVMISELKHAIQYLSVQKRIQRMEGDVFHRCVVQ